MSELLSTLKCGYLFNVLAGTADKWAWNVSDDFGVNKQIAAISCVNLFIIGICLFFLEKSE